MKIVRRWRVASRFPETFGYRSRIARSASGRPVIVPPRTSMHLARTDVAVAVSLRARLAPSRRTRTRPSSTSRPSRARSVRTDAMASPFDDPSSQSNYPAVKVTHVDFDVDVDFDTKTIAGTVALRAVVGDAPSEELVLDTRDLTIESCRVDGMDASFDLQAKPHAVMGAALTVKLGETRSGTTIDVVVSYRTSPSSSAVQWLRPSHRRRKHPYLFRRRQAIQKALYPCQDTPAAKLTYGAKVTVPAPLRALMSAIPVGEGVPSGAAGKTRRSRSSRRSIPLTSSARDG